MTEQDVLDMAYRFGWMDKGGCKERKPLTVLITIAANYYVGNERIHQQIVERYQAGYNDCPPDWVKR